MSTTGPARGGNEVSPASPVLTLRSVSKAFGAVQALREVSVDCRAGEIHALVGENGSGKSTLLEHRERLPRSRRGHRRDRRDRAPARLSRREPAGSVSASPIRRTRTCCTCRWPRTSTSRHRPTSDRRTGAWTDGRPTGWPSSTSTSRRPRRPGRSRSRSGSSSRSSRHCSPSRRCCCSTSRRRRSGPRTSTACTRSFTNGAAPASGSSTSATGCPRSSASPIGSAFSATACARGRSRRPRCRRRASSLS